jgi:Ca2+-binding RTX toxin-like protein
MAFQAYDGGMFGIYVADADGTVTATLVDDASNAATETAWSPDGAQVAWFGVNDQTGRSGAVLTRPADASSDAQVVALPGGRTATPGGFAWVPAGPWDADTDGDGVADGDDNCPTSANAGQTDADGDGTGDVCDANDQDGPAGDADGDGIPNASDPDDTDGPTGDTDNDGVTNTDDNCPSASNAGQADTDGDGTGDACDSTPNGDAPAPTCSHQQATVYVANGTIVGGPDAGRPYSGTLRGTGGRDVIVGTRAADHISSGGGNDLVCGLGASDSITGNGGSDRLIGGPGDDTLAGGAGIDTLQGRDGNDVLTGGAQADRFMGGPGTDTATDFRRSEGDTRAGIP